MNSTKFIQAILWIIRIVVGGLFIFSGLVKANDPNGLAYKMEEFFQVWAKEGYMPGLMGFLEHYILPFAIIMIVLEIVAGVAIIIGYRFKAFSFFIFLLTAFFTFLTAYVLFSGNIKECGCFGDCIKLKPIETFYKDVALMILITFLLLYRTKISDVFSKKTGTIIMLIVLAASIFMQFYVLKNLPFVDCLAYKKGNNIMKEMLPGKNYKPAVYEDKMVYENIKTGEKKEFDLNNMPWQDSLTWKYLDRTTKLISEAENEPKIKDFSVMDYDGYNLTEELLAYPEQVFLLFIKNVNEANTSTIEKLKTLIAAAKSKNIDVIALSSSNDIETNQFKKKHNIELPFYQTDGVVIKTAMRTNPGLILLKKGTIMGKWSYNNYPSMENLNLEKNQMPLIQEADEELTDSLSK